VNNSYNGINGMPAKGLCADCTKEEIGLAVQYMLDSI
jgi:cytochrome c5